jgi:hypothetical protein
MWNATNARSHSTCRQAWTSLNHRKNVLSVLIVLTACLSELTETLGKQTFSSNDWWIRVNTRLDGNLRRSGKRLRYSSTAARELPLQKPYTKCMSQYSTWEYTNGILVTHYTYHSLWNHSEYCIILKEMQGYAFHASAAPLSILRDKTPSWLLSFVEPKEFHHFQLPLSRKPFNFGHRCFGLYRYSLTQGTPCRSLVRSSCYTLYNIHLMFVLSTIHSVFEL